MTKGTFYSVGVGPGDPQLMTLAAVNTIKACEVIAVPQSGGRENAALAIAKDYLDGKKIISCDLPMTRDQEALAQYHQAAADLLAKFLDQGRDVAFLTIGDPSVYSTAMYVHRKLAHMGYVTKMIAGVPSFCAAAAALNVPLCEGGEPLHIIPASYGDVRAALALCGTQVLMKSGKSIRAVKDAIDAEKKDAMAVECCGMPEEKIHQTMETVSPDASYFSVIVVKEKKK